MAEPFPLAEHGFRAHEFGDSMLIERQARVPLWKAQAREDWVLPS
jgi:hypothetical protein